MTTQTAPARPTKAASSNLRRSGTHGRRWWREVAWRYLVAIVMIVICVTPLLYVISASLNPGGTLVGSNNLFRTVSGENFADLEARVG